MKTKKLKLINTVYTIYAVYKGIRQEQFLKQITQVVVIRDRYHIIYVLKKSTTSVICTFILAASVCQRVCLLFL